jgi:hypothetical protein
MDNVSRPLIALLVGTVAFFALWLVALKPSSSSSSGSSQGNLGTYQSAIDKAHQAVGISNKASVAHGGTVAPTAGKPASRTPARTTASPSVTVKPAPSKPATPAHNPAAARHRLDVVTRALDAKHVVAMLFYNPAATDDRAVKQELATVPSHGKRVVKLAVPISELARYTVVTNQVPVNESPTLVLIDAARHATTIVGFADGFEISHRVDDALAVR